MNPIRKRIVILISGRGSNMRALVEAARGEDFPAEVVGVISDRADAEGLLFARKAGIDTAVVGRADFADVQAQEAALLSALRAFAPDIVCLAGFMRLLSEGFVSHWAGRMVNIHPSLLPLFRGLHPHRQALEAGVRVHGCSVHFVTAETDAGPIIAQAAVSVASDDTESSLSARVLSAEHRLYPLAVRLLAEGRVRMEDGRCVFDGRAPIDQAVLVSPARSGDVVDIEALARSTP